MLDVITAGLSGNVIYLRQPYIVQKNATFSNLKHCLRRQLFCLFADKTIQANTKKAKCSIQLELFCNLEPSECCLSHVVLVFIILVNGVVEFNSPINGFESIVGFFHTNVDCLKACSIVKFKCVTICTWNCYNMCLKIITYLSHSTFQWLKADFFAHLKS